MLLQNVCKVFADFPRAIMDVVEGTDPTTVTQHGLYVRALDDTTPEQGWGRGRVSLLGDAAHATIPNGNTYLLHLSCELQLPDKMSDIEVRSVSAWLTSSTLSGNPRCASDMVGYSEHINTCPSQLVQCYMCTISHTDLSCYAGLHVQTRMCAPCCGCFMACCAAAMATDAWVDGSLPSHSQAVLYRH